MISKVIQNHKDRVSIHCKTDKMNQIHQLKNLTKKVQFRVAFLGLKMMSNNEIFWHRNESIIL